MCGIFGFWGDNPNLPLLKALATLAGSRGVHGWGIVASDFQETGEGKLENSLDVLNQAKASTYVLGHTRLATIGSYLGVKQPITTPHYAVAHNGNIYNYKEIAQSIDYEMKTDCDSEVIGALLEKGYELWQISNMIQTNHAILIVKNGQMRGVNRGLPLYYWVSKEGVYYCSRKFPNSKPVSALTK